MTYIECVTLGIIRRIKRIIVKYMNQTKTISKTSNLSLIIQFALFLGLAIGAPFLGNQLLTGTIVNGLLVISAYSLGFRGAMLIALLPSSISLFVGLLPVAMAPMVPFIIMSNILLVLVVSKFRGRNYFVGGVSAAFVKAIFLFVISYIMFNLFLTGPGAKIASSMMGYMQLLTAMLGVLVAYPFVKNIK